MNLHAVVAPIIAAVNPNIVGQYQASTGYTTGANGRQVPVYAAAIDVTIQVQALTTRDLRQLDGLNLQGSDQAIYCYGTVNGVSRPQIKGGDLFTYGTGSAARTALVTAVLEDWSLTAGWCKVAVTLQMPAS